MTSSESPGEHRGGAPPQWASAAVVVLLAAILATQWMVHLSEAREAAHTRHVLESIQTLLQKAQQDNTDILGSLDDIQDQLDDLHDHIAPAEKR